MSGPAPISAFVAKLVMKQFTNGARRQNHKGNERRSPEVTSQNEAAPVAATTEALSNRATTENISYAGFRLNLSRRHLQGASRKLRLAIRGTEDAAARETARVFGLQDAVLRALEAERSIFFALEDVRGVIASLTVERLRLQPLAETQELECLLESLRSPAAGRSTQNTAA